VEDILRRVFMILLGIVLAVGISGCAAVNKLIDESLPVEHLVPNVLATYPHDPKAFTEGLLLVDGHLYESTGEYGESTLREVEVETGKVLNSYSLPAAAFGEGIALVGDNLYQLTWREGAALVLDRATLKPITALPYTNDGWGMCYDGQLLYTSDGSDHITERTTERLASVGTLDVRLDGQPVEQVNELECVGDSIYANVWHTDNILRIDKASGRVTAVIDASGLITPEQRAALDLEAVLNGIAYDAQTDTFLVTGKRWPWLFRVQFVAP
jgi:glutaminyl-peptide cyclotransferase